MDFIKQWTICVCVTLVISVIFSILTPRGKMQSFYKMMISLFIFLSFLYPFQSFSIKDLKVNSSLNIEEFEQYNNLAIENMISAKVKDTLNNYDIQNANVSSSVDYNNGEINIKDVTVAIGDEYESENVKGIIFNELGINAEVHYIGN